MGALPSASQMEPMANVTAVLVLQSMPPFNTLAASVNASVVDVGHSAVVAGTRQTPSLLPLEHAVQYMVLARLRRAPALGSSTRTVTVTSRVDTWQVSHVRWHAACFAHCALFAAIAAAVGAKLALPPGAKRGVWAMTPFAVLPTPPSLALFHTRCSSVQGLLMHLEFAVVASAHGNSLAQSTGVPSASLPESLQVSELVTLFT
mmetsp:Transcript_34305/g.81671  ORF Transcript_34305/g.81671 Transcript_34305/m.81671 type:complete len:204 (-) Transcript_34305:311-922(-)